MSDTKQAQAAEGSFEGAEPQDDQVQVPEVDTPRSADAVFEMLQKEQEAAASSAESDDEGNDESEESEESEGDGQEQSAESEEDSESEEGEDGESEEAEPKAEEQRPAREIGGKRRRVRTAHLDEQEQRVLDLVSQGKKLSEAQAAVYGTESSEDKPKEEGNQQESEPVTLATKRDELTQIDQQIAEARKEYDNDKVLDLIDRKNELRFELYRLEQEEAANQRQGLTELQTRQQAAENRAYQLYPEAANDDSPLSEAIDDRVEYYRQHLPAIFDTPNWPLTIAAEAAAELGIAPATAKQKQAKSPQTPNRSTSQPKKSSRPVSPAAGTSAEVKQPDVQQEYEQAMNSSNPQDVLEFLSKHGRKTAGKAGLVTIRD